MSGPKTTIHGSNFENKDGDQSIAQGDGAIGQQNNNSSVIQTVSGSGNIFDPVYVEQNHHAAPPSIIPDQRPAPEPCFLHREQEIAWLLNELHPGKVVAVCGPGGMGKSALAVLAVSKLEESRFPDGIVFHSFYSHPKTEEALKAICAAFQVEAKAELESAVRQALSGKKALLMLDGTEQADDLKAVLDLRGQCGALITSRKRTDAQGVRLDLIPLEERQAVEIFLEYSGPVDDMASVAGICTLLGGWPVALRIAGRYLSSTGESAADYLRWLEQEPFKELGDGQHQEENAALLLRRSVDTVSEYARQALSVFGVLAFEPVARESIASILDENIRCCRLTLNELVTYGLLERSGERWQISHALVHTYARTELALSKDALARLAGWYIAFCEAASEEGVKGYARLDAERAHCLRLMESCLASKLWQEVKGLEGAVYRYLNIQAHWPEQLAAFEMRLTAARQAGDRKDEGLFLNSLGRTYNWRGEHEKALVCCKQSLAIRREIGDRHEEARNLNNIAKIYVAQGKHEQALDYYKQSLTIAREIGDRQGEGWTVNNVGQFYYYQGDYEQALSYYEQCLPIRQEVGDNFGKVSTLNNIGLIYHAQGDYTKTLEYHEQALAICQQIGDRAGEAVTCWNIGLTYEDMSDLAKAEEHIAHAVQLAEQIGHPSLEKWCEGLARVRAAQQAAPCG